MKDNYKADVLFLWERDEPKDVFAYFPQDMDYTLQNPDLRGCYAHIGQHSACHPDYARECKEASPDEFKPLMEELESIGYDLNILNK
jgi:hypothetical protein